MVVEKSVLGQKRLGSSQHTVYRCYPLSFIKGKLQLRNEKKAFYMPQNADCSLEDGDYIVCIKKRLKAQTVASQYEIEYMCNLISALKKVDSTSVEYKKPAMKELLKILATKGVNLEFTK
jgi:hypothetical protein